MAGERRFHRQQLDARSQSPEVYSLWGETEAPARDASPRNIYSTKELAQNLDSVSEPVVLFCLSPLTNPAQILREFPKAMKPVKRIYIMGGNLAETSEVDTNFAVDPLAASTILDSDIPLTLVPLDVTRTTELSMNTWHTIRKRNQGSTKLADIEKWLLPWLRHSDQTRPVNGMWLHDLAAIMAFTDPEIFRTQVRNVSISNTPWGKLRFDENGTEVEVVRDIDNALLLERLADCFAHLG